ncbi:MAG: thioredoxin [Muribaculaceae bacterium]|nr:thioredoxin [Muribaculaceae bacterium]
MLGASLSLSAKNVVEANDKTFATEIESGYSIVDFWAVWCGPCRAFAPIFEELSDEFKGEVKFIKVNVDNATQIAQKYQIRSIPTLILFKDGEEVQKWIGGRPKETLRTMIKESIK